ncbi:hypothetical protein BDV25DRAFT_138256 [Aspergillus avenaceus]|uniref:Cyanovirin-N domain-containing protein n=1 Tax=Aspergillus avenaceus TaxID=36643 RepID=A0A5N6U1G7_ASPAV|nr:hypothetical protein BDV25DRAFT_138256 [Aspergillus avenaceus]
MLYILIIITLYLTALATAGLPLPPEPVKDLKTENLLSHCLEITITNEIREARGRSAIRGPRPLSPDVSPDPPRSRQRGPLQRRDLPPLYMRAKCRNSPTDAFHYSRLELDKCLGLIHEDSEYTLIAMENGDGIKKAGCRACTYGNYVPYPNTNFVYPYQIICTCRMDTMILSLRFDGRGVFEYDSKSGRLTCFKNQGTLEAT